MKIIKATCIACLALFPVVCDAKLGPKWMQRSGQMAETAQSAPSRENVLKLGKELIGVNGYNSGSVEESLAVQKITSTLMAIPGHAKYFAEELERERAELLPGQYRGDYDKHRREYLQGVLPHLPSAETIQILGRYLEDDRDTPEQRIRYSGGCVVTLIPGSSWMSCYSLGRIGLRAAPVPGDISKTPYKGSEVYLEQARAWWEEVKAGRKTFSFKGQSVEYRFRPDGTWETLAMVNAPDDGPKVAGRVERPGVGKAEPGAGEIPRGWVWLVFPVILAAVFGIWFVSRKFGKGL